MLEKFGIRILNLTGGGELLVFLPEFWSEQ